MIINNKHIGLLHHNEVFQKLEVGDKLTGFIKKIHAETNKIDVVTGRPGYEKVGGEAERIMQILKDHNGFLPYNDKSDPKDIYNFFGISKKTFKMATGQLYKNKLIEFNTAGIKITGNED
jgi:predicted RNA-binding protein (virulence factor B family)